MEIARLKDHLTDAKVQNEEKSTQFVETKHALDTLTVELAGVKKQHKRSQIDTKEFSVSVCEKIYFLKNYSIQKNLKTIEALRNRLEKIEEINEILLAEYKRVENERNSFVDSRFHGVSRAHELERQLDNVRLNNGGLHLFWALIHQIFPT